MQKKKKIETIILNSVFQYLEEHKLQLEGSRITIKSTWVRINFSELYHEKLCEKNLLVLVSQQGSEWSEGQNIFKFVHAVEIIEKCNIKCKLA